MVAPCSCMFAISILQCILKCSDALASFNFLFLFLLFQQVWPLSTSRLVNAVYSIINHIYVVVQFYPWFNFIFLCFKLINILYNTQKQTKRNFEPRIKLNHNIYTTLLLTPYRLFMNLQLATKLLTHWPFNPLLLQFYICCSCLVNLSTPFSPKQCCIMILWTFSYIRQQWIGEGGFVNDLGCGKNRSVIQHINRVLQTWCVN